MTTLSDLLYDLVTDAVNEQNDGIIDEEDKQELVDEYTEKILVLIRRALQ